MIVLMFQPRFAPLVKSGEKQQTIRLPRKRPIKIGDELSLREWSGKPYASKQRILLPALRCHGVRDILLEESTYGLFIWLEHIMLSLRAAETMAKLDGFKSLLEMGEWFNQTHGLPFHGVVISW